MKQQLLVMSLIFAAVTVLAYQGPDFRDVVYDCEVNKQDIKLGELSMVHDNSKYLEDHAHDRLSRYLNVNGIDGQDVTMFCASRNDINEMSLPHGNIGFSIKY